MVPPFSITFLGSGSAFTTDPDNYQSNVVLRGAGESLLLLDCGGDARRAFQDLGLTVRDVGAVYISHLHADHIGGLEWLGFSSYFDPSRDRPVLFSAEANVDDLWSRSLSGGMRTITGAEVGLDDYFDVRRLEREDRFEWEGVKLRLVPTPHVRGAERTVESFGLYIEGPNKKVYLTTDTIFEPHAELDTADLVFHDCETSPFPTDVHPPYQTLVSSLTPEVRARTWLYGYNPGALPDAAADGFLGFVKRAQQFEL